MSKEDEIVDEMLEELDEEAIGMEIEFQTELNDMEVQEILWMDCSVLEELLVSNNINVENKHEIHNQIAKLDGTGT